MPRHNDRQDLAGEHALGDMGQILLLLIFLSIWIIDSFFLNFSTFLSNQMPLYLKILLSIIILFISLYFAKAGHDIIFGEIRKELRVISHGVFSLVRHPLYLAAILFYLALLLFSFSIIAAFIWIIIIVFYNYIAKYEEKILLEKFGKKYEEYMREVPMWIPRLRKK